MHIIYTQQLISRAISCQTFVSRHHNHPKNDIFYINYLIIVKKIRKYRYIYLQVTGMSYKLVSN